MGAKISRILSKSHDLTEETTKFEVAHGPDIYEGNLEMKGAMCQKNPGHKGFIAVKDFDLCHLPRKFQYMDVFEWIKKQADLTVLIRTYFVSKKRPKRFLPNQNSKLRGQPFPQTASGFCYGVRRCGNTAQSDQFCECQACKQSGYPKTSWWEVYVQTAAHVVFDDEEAANTDVVFFYDDTESQTITIQGTRMGYSFVERDRCKLVCVVHEGEKDEVMNKLKGLWQDVKTVGSELNEKYMKVNWDDLCVIISHPHGSTKQVSVAECVKEERTGDGVVVGCYNTPTCPGSSGAGVKLGYGLFYLLGPPHSRGGQDGLGRSGDIGIFVHVSE